MIQSDPVIEWLLDSDPSIRWQVMRDLLDAPEREWMAERAKVETEGWGARLLSCQDEDGQWAGGAFLPAGFDPHEWKERGQPCTATTFSLSQLREFGLDPACGCARRTVKLVGANARWEEGGQPYWEGEVEECINGRTVADGAYFGVDISPIVERLIGERLDDGGWNCERARGSVRSSFASTINVLEGLLEYERSTGGTHRSREARRTGEEFLLARNLFRRLGTGEPADERFLRLLHPNRWRYDILRALDYFRASAILTGADPDPRLGEAIDHLLPRRLQDGRWPLDDSPAGRVWFEVDDGQGKPSRWVTLRAMRVLRWWDAQPSGRLDACNTSP
ncbi:squalene cyclase [Rhizobium laguerreae]|uniref:squalene cyclase n=1 Tax=Rhizobium laguerreae TaxID=1076926 RepID=UPI001C91285D|nr:squalene cyclase [Rhizobium laguerreae]MBY3142888.1 squalene cyclase [Rhizobium laguerreae]